MLSETELVTELILTTPRLLLTLPPPERAQQVSRYFRSNRQHLQRWEPSRPASYYRRDFWRRRLQENRDEYASGTSLRLFLCSREQSPGEILGSINYTQFVGGAFQACTLGYSLDQQAQGHGYLQEALQCSLEFVFETLAMHRVMASYMLDNLRSEKVLQRAGFEREGLARDYLFVDGEWRDHVLTSKIRVLPEVQAESLFEVRAAIDGAGATGL